jgi:hypothetical protein
MTTLQFAQFMVLYYKQAIDILCSMLLAHWLILYVSNYSSCCTTAGNIGTLDILVQSDYSWDKDAEYTLLERAKQNKNQQVIDWMEQQIAITETANAKKAQQRSQPKENAYFPNINKNHLGTAFGEQLLASNQQAYMTQKRDSTVTTTGSAAGSRQQQQQQQQQSSARQSSASKKVSQTTVTTPRVRTGPLLATDSTLHTRTPLDHDFVVSVIRDMQPDDPDEYSDNDSSSSSSENRTS